MKKTALALALILACLVAAVLGVESFQVAYAQFEGLPYDPPIVTILSPSPNVTYTVPSVPLNISVQLFGFIYHNMETVKWLNYSLDGQPVVPMTFVLPSDLSPGYYAYGKDVLANLSDGAHSLTIYGETAISGLTGNFNATVSFKVNTSTTPIAEIFPATLAFVLSVGNALAVIGLYVYFKKRKR